MGDFETNDNADPASTFPNVPKPAAEPARTPSSSSGPHDDLSTLAPDSPRWQEASLPPVPPPEPRSRRALGRILGGVAGLALVALGFVLLFRAPTPEPTKQPLGPAANVPPKAAAADQRVIDWVGSRKGTVTVGSAEDVLSSTHRPGWVIAIELKNQPTIADMPSLGGLKELRYLQFERCGITDQTVADMPELPTLVKLTLTGNPISDAGVAYFSRFPAVVDFGLDGTKVTDAALDMLATRSALKRLDVRRTSVTRAGVKRFADQLPKCDVQFDFTSPEAPPEPKVPAPAADGDRAIALWALSKKGVVGLAKPARQVKSAAELPKEPFQVDLIQVTLKSGGLRIPAFTELAEITRLELTCNELTDVDLAALGAMPKLWIFRVSGPITDAALPSVLRYPLLRYVGLSRTKITDVGLASVAKTSALENLRLAGSASITDAGLAAFAGHDRLQTLDLTNCVGITDACVSKLKSLPKLTELYVEGTRVSREGAAKLAEELPRCRVVSDFGTVERKK